MVSFIDDPNKMNYMGQMGMGLLAASQPQPYGVNRYSLLMNAMGRANQDYMQRQLFDMKKQEYEDQLKERDSKKAALAKLFGGPDPSTGITWDAGREGMSDSEKMGIVGQVAPGAAIGKMLEKPAAPARPYMVQKGREKVWYRDLADGTREELGRGPAFKPSEPTNVSAITLEHPTEGAVTLDRRDPRLKKYLQPGSGWVETSRSKQGELPATRVDDIKADLGAVSRARSRISQMITAVKEDKSRAGLVGTAKRWGQTALGITADLADVGIDVGGVVGETVVGLKKDLNEGSIDPEVTKYFDEKLPQNTVFENSLAYQLARARKGDRRINMEDFKAAKNDINLTGLTSSSDVIARLRAIDMEFAEAEQDLNARIGQPAGEPVYEIRDGKLVRVE